ncbi:P-loop containing nucleoside triphosphate hydrolase protein [Hypoxylon crocopeplum]|nr:P-loop containing nucleoside triphosphate hydrolase protein [Hypoxylon crocopeplum]
MASSVALGSLAAEAATSLASLILAFCSSWKMTLVLLATVPVSIIILALLSRTLKPAIQAQKQELARASKHAISAITAIDIVKISNAIDHELWQYLQAIRRSMDKYLVQARANAYQLSYIRFWMDGLFVVGFYYGVVLVNQGLTPGNVMTTFFAALVALQGLDAFIPMYMALARGMSAGQDLSLITNNIEGGRTVHRMIGSYLPKSCFGDIEIRNVSFAYPSNPSTYVLKDSSFSFDAGQLYFIVGRSGSGKSTLGNLLMQFYEPVSGSISIDGYPLKTLDNEWVRSNVTLVQQTSVLFNDTISMNVAMGRQDPTQVSRAEVKAACETALLQSTLATLPDGLNTHVGPGGHDLSGGQKQRLALARAKIRDPPVLILDEITSGLDPMSRSLIMDAIRQWRRGKTTIIITHEVAQIKDYDFVYVMDDARVVQQGFRRDLKWQQDGVFALLVASSTVDDAGSPTEENNAVINFSRPRSAANQQGHPLSNYFWPFSQYEDHPYLPRRATLAVGASAIDAQQFLNQKHWDDEADPGPPESGTQSMILRTIGSLSRQLSGPRRFERHRLPLSVYAQKTVLGRKTSIIRLQEIGEAVQDNRGIHFQQGRQLTPLTGDFLTDHFKLHEEEKSEEAKYEAQGEGGLSLWAIYRTVWPCLALKERIFLITGFMMCIVVAGAVPAFSFAFANLLALLSSNEDRMAAGKKWALYLLFIAMTAASSTFFSHFLLQWAGQAWVNALRMRALNRILRQPKVWFDTPKNSVSRISECMDRNAEEMRNLVGRFAPLLLIIVIMILGTVIWALIISWRLTLVALASAPLLIAATQGYTYVSRKWEKRCDEAIESMSAVVTESLINIRVVRALALEQFFSQKHEECVREAFNLGVKKTVWTSVLYASWQSVFWFMMALIFWYATRLLAFDKDVTVQAILQVINLLVLGLTTASNMLNSLPGIATAQATASQMLYYAYLPLNASHESTGKIKLPRPFPIRLDDLSFTYPSVNRAVIRNLSLRFDAGTSTAIVGPSGCGKSTIASIILRLYAPDSGGQPERSSRQRQLTFASLPAYRLSTTSLRSHIGYVPQAPFLFPASLAVNIAYGLPEDSPLRDLENLERAAKEAGIHDFIYSLEAGYDTVVGDGGQTLSGGQAQRVCIARALARRPKILILDEPTSALDAESAEVVRDTIESLMEAARTGLPTSHHTGREELAVIVVTHNRDMMRMVDRIVVIDQGRVAESGSYDELLAKKGKFTELLSGGQWMGNDGGSDMQNTAGGGQRAGQTAADRLPLRSTDNSDEQYPDATTRWVGLRDVYWPDDRGPSTGLMSPLTSPFPGPSRRKERRGDDNV